MPTSPEPTPAPARVPGLVSIITPSRARPRELRRAIESVRRQTHPLWELLVIDDGAGEALAVVQAARAGGEGSRLRALDNRRRGIVAARNLGIASARGSVLAFLDDDDRWEDRHRLATAVAMLARENALLYQTGWIFHQHDGSREPYPHQPTAADLRRNNQLLTSSVVYPAHLHDRLGPLAAHLGNYADWDWTLRVLDAGYRLREIPGPGVVYAVHDHNTSGQLEKPERQVFFERFRERHGLEIEMLNHLLMHRRLSAEAGPVEKGEVESSRVGPVERRGE